MLRNTFISEQRRARSRPALASDAIRLRYAEAARTLGVRETTLTNRVFRARRHVVQALA